MPPEVLPLCAFAFLAGFLDAIVGGGGLIQVPALFVLLPGVPAATLLGTNKCVSIVGTAGAALHYLRRVELPWRVALSSGLTALPLSYIGARTVTGLDPALLRPLILALLVGVLIYTLFNARLGHLQTPRLSRRMEIVGGLLTGAALGFYDGFFGPGTGSFLIFIFVSVFGYNFLTASATAKVVNLLTNLAAIIWFAGSGHVWLAIAVPMALSNFAGAQIGARLALRHGNRFVRVLFIIVVGLLILRYAHDLIRS